MNAVKEALRGLAILLGPWALFFAIWFAASYLAPCSWMGGCSPLNTPNRCSR